MASHEILSIAGNLGSDPQMRFMPDGTAICNFSVACNRVWTNSAGQKQEQVIWYRVSAWGKLGENVHQYKRKGDFVIVDGRLTPDENGNPRIWNKQDGSPASSFEVSAQRVVFGPSARQNDPNAADSVFDAANENQDRGASIFDEDGGAGI